MNFGEAIEAMRQGKSVWSPRFDRAVNPVACLRLIPGTAEHRPFIAWVMPDGTWEPMSYSHKNVLAEDWEVLDDTAPAVTPA